MAASIGPGSCPLGADNQFGPRVHVACRAFDFTLQFEDACFVALPAAIFLLLVPWRLGVLWKTSTKMASHRLLVGKLLVLFILFGLHLLFLILGPHTKFSAAAASLSAAAILEAGILSFMEDRRSVQPSDLLVIYLSASAILSIPRLRSLWLVTLPSSPAARPVWTIIFVGTVLAVFLESLGKSRFLKPPCRQNVTKEQTAGFWSRSFFIWVLPFFQTGYSRILSLRDVPNVDDALAEEAAWGELDRFWNRTAGRYRLVRATFAANTWAFFSAVPPRLALSAFLLCQPFLIGTAVSTVADPAQQGEEEYGRALVGAFILVHLGIAVSRAIYWRQANRMVTRLRCGLIAMIYRHTTSLRVADARDSAALTLMGTDVERIVQALRYAHELWASIPEVAVALWLLTRQVSYAALMPLVICLASVAAISVVGARSGSAQAAWNERVEKRVAITANMLGNMRAVKMLGLSDILHIIIENLRQAEIRTSETFRYLHIWEILLSNVPTTLAPFTAFAVYAIIAAVREDETLLSVQAFTSLSLISLVTNPLIFFCHALPACIQAVACFGRIESYCLRRGQPSQPESPQEPQTDILLASLRTSQPSAMRPAGPLASFSSANVAWPADATEPLLRDLDLHIMPGFTAIIGPVGSGKSTLLETLVGETVVKRGSVVSNVPRAAFCSQTPWISDTTIRQNVTAMADTDFDQKWYEFSVQACGLQQDLQTLPAGDLTFAGSNGSSLSGGQRQRVALARAVYSRLPLVILDDVTSGLDPATVNTIFNQLFHGQGHFRKAGISVVLATHSRRLLPFMDDIIVLDSGRIVDRGSYSEIQSRGTGPVEYEEDITEERTDEHQKGQSDVTGQSELQIPTSDPELAEVELEADLQRRQGSWSLYGYYARRAGTLHIVLWGLFTLIGAVAANYTTIWIERWSDANSDEPNQNLGLYLGIYALLTVIATLGTAGECWVFMIKIISHTALQLHTELLDTVLAAPFAFFQTTDTGTTTNRFSQDMDLIDMTLPSHAIQFTTSATTCLVQLVILCILGRYFAAVIPVLAAVLFTVQKYYLRSSRQVRLLDIEAKAPLYKIFIETVSGISTIRSFGRQAAFHEKHKQILNDAQRPFYMLMCIQQWLALVLDLIVGAIAVVLVALATSLAGSISAGALGVGLVLILEFNDLISQCLQSWTRLETSIGAVARVRKFIRETPSEPIGSAALPLVDWPMRGAVGFEGVSASYGSDDNLVLSDINLHIAPGEKLAICGASGSGKTSLIMTLLRMTELRQGTITIDGVDIAGLAGGDVRGKLNVIPQEPFFMPGTVRFNLDPQGRASDDAIEAAIRRVGLWGRISSGTGGGLDKELVAAEWSQGELQLLALARALLVPSKILVLDEATSSVDDKTEAIMQEVIDTEWRGRTVISVLHRFAHIKQFDRVAVLSGGRLVECDASRALLGRLSAFREVYRAFHEGR